MYSVKRWNTNIGPYSPTCRAQDKHGSCVFKSVCLFLVVRWPTPCRSTDCIHERAQSAATNTREGVRAGPLHIHGAVYRTGLRTELGAAASAWHAGVAVPVPPT